MGISIGLTRLFWQLRDAGLMDGIAESSVQAMVVLMDEATLDDALDIARCLRIGGINTRSTDGSKKGQSKQFQYASRAGIRFVVLAGDDGSWRGGVVAVKDLTREQQFEIPREELASTLQVELEQAKRCVTASPRRGNPIPCPPENTRLLEPQQARHRVLLPHWLNLIPSLTCATACTASLGRSALQCR